MMRYTHQPLHVILAALTDALRDQPAGTTVTVTAPDPDLRTDLYSGEPLDIDGEPCVYRDLRAWLDLADALGCALGTPRPAAPGFVTLPLRKLDPDQSWHRGTLPSGAPEKYGAQTPYARIRKPEEPTFLAAIRDTLRFLSLPVGATILSVGANQGDTLNLVRTLLTRSGQPPSALTGLDHSRSAIEAGRRRHPALASSLFVADLREPLPVGRFDLIIAINVLHSPQIDGAAILARLRREHLAQGGALLIGYPNSRYRDHRLIPGATLRNYAHPEPSAMLKRAMHTRRTLQRLGFTVTLTGQHTLLVAARQSRQE